MIATPATAITPVAQIRAPTTLSAATLRLGTSATPVGSGRCRSSSGLAGTTGLGSLASRYAIGAITGVTTSARLTAAPPAPEEEVTTASSPPAHPREADRHRPGHHRGRVADRRHPERRRDQERRSADHEPGRSIG